VYFVPFVVEVFPPEPEPENNPLEMGGVPEKRNPQVGISVTFWKVGEVVQ